MYFIKYHPLKDRLKQRTLSDGESFYYFFAYSILVSMYLLPFGQSSDGFWDWSIGISSVACTILGLLYSYKRNGGKDGYDFILKFVVIFWIVMIRCVIVLIPCSIFFYFIVNYFISVSEVTTSYDFILVVVFEAVMYQRIGKHIAETW